MKHMKRFSASVVALALTTFAGNNLVTCLNACIHKDLRMATACRNCSKLAFEHVVTHDNRVSSWANADSRNARAAHAFDC